MSEEVLFLAGISIHVLREEDDDRDVYEQDYTVLISIHVLREEDDLILLLWRFCVIISIHVLREEDDRSLQVRSYRGALFLSTSSARRTTAIFDQVIRVANISIHVLREEDDRVAEMAARLTDISIHVLREEDDGMTTVIVCATLSFLSTSSARRTTIRSAIYSPLREISIHVLREEDDSDAVQRIAQDFDFYPRPPRGGRPVITA